MPWLDVVDIMYDNQIQFLVQCRVIDDDAVIDVRQFPKLAVDNAVKRVLVAPQYLRISYLLQPPEQLLCQLLLPPFN